MNEFEVGVADEGGEAPVRSTKSSSFEVAKSGGAGGVSFRSLFALLALVVAAAEEAAELDAEVAELNHAATFPVNFEA